MGKDLTYDELANVYHIKHGGHARILPMEQVCYWAESRPDLFTFDNNSFQLRNRHVTNNK